MEDWVARFIASASALGTVAAAGIGWRTHQSQARQHTEGLDQLEREISVLGESLEESRRQWEESGSSIIIHGTFRPHNRDRHLDEVEIVIANSGRLETYVRRILLSDRANIASLELEPERGLPAPLRPGEPIEIVKTVGELLTSSLVFSSGAALWEGMIIRVWTGDNREYSWAPPSSQGA